MATKEITSDGGSDRKIHSAEEPISTALIGNVARHIVVSERFHFALEHLNVSSANYLWAEDDTNLNEDEMNLRVIV